MKLALIRAKRMLTLEREFE